MKPNSAPDKGKPDQNVGNGEKKQVNLSGMSATGCLPQLNADDHHDDQVNWDVDEGDAKWDSRAKVSEIVEHFHRRLSGGVVCVIGIAGSAVGDVDD